MSVLSLGWKSNEELWNVLLLQQRSLKPLPLKRGMKIFHGIIKNHVRRERLPKNDPLVRWISKELAMFALITQVTLTWGILLGLKVYLYLTFNKKLLSCKNAPTPDGVDTSLLIAYPIQEEHHDTLMTTIIPALVILVAVYSGGQTSLFCNPVEDWV